MEIKSASTITNLPAERHTAPLSKKEAPLPKDTIDISKKEQPEMGFLHKGFRLVAKAAVGAVSAVAGASMGAVKGAATESVLQMTDSSRKLIRGIGAMGGLINGMTMGLITGGPVGLVLGAIVGPVIGSAVGGAVPGIIDGASSAIRGGGKGAVSGFKKGAANGAAFVDWVAAGLSKPAESIPQAPVSPKK